MLMATLNVGVGLMFVPPFSFLLSSLVQQLVSLFLVTEPPSSNQMIAYHMLFDAKAIHRHVLELEQHIRFRSNNTF